MTTFVQIAINVPSLAGVFDYVIPEDMRGKAKVGDLVLVPFGRQTVQGVILRFVEQPAVPNVKAIIELVDPDPVLTGNQIALVERLAQTTYSPLASMIGLFLPPGLSQQADTIYSIRETGRSDQQSAFSSQLLAVNDPTPPSPKSTILARLMKLLEQRGPLRGRQIDHALPRLEWRRSAQYLIKRGDLTTRSVLPPSSVRPKFIRTAQLAVPPRTAEAELANLGSTEATRGRRQKAMRFLIRQPEAIDVAWVYAESGCNAADLQELAERDLITLRETEIWRDPLGKAANSTQGSAIDNRELILTSEQEAAWQAIRLSMEDLKRGQNIKPFLLQGVTGSGKTELYIRAAEETVRGGRQAILLVPEISLTPQTVQRLLMRFPGQVGLIHSRLSDGERYDTWRRARAGLLPVIIGPRSALFAPLPNPGLIVVDECHDSSYYQSEPPFYHAVTAAQEYARLCGAVCIMGSATPSVEQRYQAESGHTVRLELSQRISSEPDAGPARGLDLPSVHLVDMREELKAGGRGIFSRELTEALRTVLKRGEQAILFLNRRGTATYVFCRDCGYVVKCPRCDTPLTYHLSSGEQLLCHRCGYKRQMLKKCPECGGSNIRAYGLGSEKVEAEVQALFPAARTLRWDWETTRQKDSHEIILGHFAAGRADVLIGTQMLAKGLDLPRVTLVGIVMADVGLFLPDPFAAERVFQILTQVAGRAGRSSRGGRVVLQTFAPEHYAVRAASKHDVNGFYELELAQRKRLGYPPFSELMRLEYRHYEAGKAERAATELAERIMKQAAIENRRSSVVIGPAPSFFSKLDGRYRWQIILRGSNLNGLIPAQLASEWRIEANPVSLL